MACLHGGSCVGLVAGVLYEGGEQTTRWGGVVASSVSLERGILLG